MKKILKNVILAITLTLGFSFNSYAAPVSDDVILIPISSGDDGSTGLPKSPTLSPIRCTYSDSSAILEFTFLSNLGNLTITVVNTSSGEVVSTTVDSSLGYEALPISGDSGYYVISIVSSGGNNYYGSFTL